MYNSECTSLISDISRFNDKEEAFDFWDTGERGYSKVCILIVTVTGSLANLL